LYCIKTQISIITSLSLTVQPSDSVPKWMFTCLLRAVSPDMRILIAEDDSILADGLSRSLRYDGYAADVVNDGSAADSALQLQSFDLLILDLDLPSMHGLAVLRMLRQRQAGIPVLILTAADTVEQRVKGLDLGADDYM